MSLGKIIRGLLRGRRTGDTQLDRELRHHLDEQVEANVAAGMPPEEARRQAMLAFGGVERFKEECRDERPTRLLEDLVQDLRYGLRQLRRSPGFTIVAVLTLALGIGANTTIFTVMNAVLLKPLPYPESSRLVLVWETVDNQPENITIASWPNFEDWRGQNSAFQEMGLFDSAGRGYNLSDGVKPEQVSGVRVTASFFRVLGVQPLYGRTFLDEEETAGRERVVVLSHGLWKRRYGGDPGLVGRAIRMDGHDVTVVGVMPPDFRFQFWGGERELWVPIALTEGDRDRGSHSFVCLARLKPGVTVEEARGQMDTIGRRLAAAHPEKNANEGATVTELNRYGLQDYRKGLIALLGAVGFVLLIACANIANLLIARGAARRKELAVRYALGASRFRVSRQILAESLLLAGIGGGAAVLLAVWSTQLVSAHLPNYLRYVPFRPLHGIELDARVLLFALGISLLTGILFGLAPALSALRTDLNEPLHAASRGVTHTGHGRLRHMLIAGEVAMALVVVAAAGLMVNSVSQLLRVPPGFDPRHVLVLSISLPQKELYFGPPGLPRFCQELDEQVGSLGGVLSVSAVSNLPMTGNAGRGFEIEGRAAPDPGQKPGAAYNVACPNYLRTMGVALVKGREFTHRDTASAPGVVIINQRMANLYWQGEDPVGKRIKMGDWLTVVGVYTDVRHWGLDREVRPEFMRPYTQAAWPTMDIAARTAGKPEEYLRAVTERLNKALPDQPVSDPGTMEEVIGNSIGVNPRQFSMRILASFSALALLLAAVGIAGVVSYTVVQSTPEIGIRMALGARTRDVLSLVLRGTLAWAVAGLALGAAGATAVTRLLAGLLYGVRPGEPMVLAAAALLLLAVVLAAAWVPARRALRVDPIIALRTE